MGITYDKHKVKKDRLVTTTGPRDHQNKRDSGSTFNNELVAELRSQISDLKSQLGSVSGWTDDKVNIEIEKAVIQELKSINLDHSLVVDKLKNKILDLELENKKLSLSIETLTRRLEENNSSIITKDDISKIVAAVGGSDSSSSNKCTRPSIEPVFVDPIEPDQGDVEQYIKIESEFGSDKTALSDKLAKLRNLVGKQENK